MYQLNKILKALKTDYTNIASDAAQPIGVSAAIIMPSDDDSELKDIASKAWWTASLPYGVVALAALVVTVPVGLIRMLATTAKALVTIPIASYEDYKESNKMIYTMGLWNTSSASIMTKLGGTNNVSTSPTLTDDLKQDTSHVFEENSQQVTRAAMDIPQIEKEKQPAVIIEWDHDNAYGIPAPRR